MLICTQNRIHEINCFCNPLNYFRPVKFNDMKGTPLILRQFIHCGNDVNGAIGIIYKFGPPLFHKWPLSNELQSIYRNKLYLLSGTSSIVALSGPLFAKLWQLDRPQMIWLTFLRQANLSEEFKELQKTVTGNLLVYFITDFGCKILWNLWHIIIIEIKIEENFIWLLHRIIVIYSRRFRMYTIYPLI